MSLYIHIGQHKTGTSSLQHFCTTYRRELGERFSLCYPTPPEDESHRHRNLFPFHRGRWEKLRMEVESSNCANILISNEDLYSRSMREEDLRQIRELFSGHDVFLVLYLRRIDDYCRSWYKQSLKRGYLSGTSYASFLQIMTRHRLRLHPLRVLNRCEKLVGRDHLLVRAYDPARLKNKNIIDDFFDLLGIDLPNDMDRGQPLNLSLPEAALPYVTDTLQRTPFKDPVNMELRRKLMQAFSPPEHADVSAEFRSGLEKEIHKIDKLYLPGYRKLHAGRPLDFTLPAPDATPRDLLIADLLYSILFELQRRKSLTYRLELFIQEKFRAARTFFSKLPGVSGRNG